MTAEEIACAILADIAERKGLGRIWAEYWEVVAPPTREQIIDAWANLIRELDCNEISRRLYTLQTRWDEVG